MKSIFTLLLVVTNVFIASAQWSNTSNLFYDSLHMPVCTNIGEQENAINIRSYPDSGYFVIWEDDRNTASTKKDIYAQKYDKAGNMLWAVNGLPVVNGPNDQHFTWSSNDSYRNRKTAVSDGVNGFYITYIDDSITNYNWSRICVQHILPNGSQVFGGAGFIVAQTPVTEAYTFSKPQLIGDELKGFYVSYIKNSDNDYVYIYGYTDDAGTMTLHGGGLMNQNGLQQLVGEACVGAYRQYINYPSTTIVDYNIWPDLQGGCSVIMHMNGNTAEQGKMLCYNRLWKAKKDAVVTVATQFATGDPTTQTFQYHKGDLDVLYKLVILNLDGSCTSNTDHFFWVDNVLLANGYLLLDQGGYEYAFPKGVTVPTSGNINVELIASLKRTIDGNTVSLSALQAYSIASEIMDSIPYQRASNNNPLIGYNTVVPSDVNTLTNFSDTLLAPGSSYSYFSLTGGGSEIYAAALMVEPGQPTRSVRLQHLHVNRETANSFAIHFTTGSNKGDLIGKELSTGFSGTDVQYDFPFITASRDGNALLSITETQRYIRVSPIGNGAELVWGAMGKPIAPVFYNGHYYNKLNPFVSLDPINGTGLISWEDDRAIPGNTGTNIFMRHLDSLHVVDYIPANKKIQALAHGSTVANPAVLTGISKKFSTMEATNTVNDITSPVAEMLDNYNLGSVTVNVYENIGAIRSYNGKAYLDRNYTIKPENNPAGAADINVRLFFTTAAFDALKAADPAITTPADLGVIKQPNTGSIVPAAYTPVTGEETIPQLGWKAVDGGYFIEIKINSFSNFFIQQVASALPVTWLGIQAQWTDNKNAKISWQVGDQQNVKDYTVQQSQDGHTFLDACQVTASAVTGYSCIVPAKASTSSYYRVLQRDMDNKFTYSRTVFLRSTVGLSLAVHPNPVKDKLYLDGIEGYHTLQVADMNGKIIQQQNVSTGLKYINISRLQAGLYLLSVRNDKEIQTLKFVKQ
jgi:hypothetical protein